MECKFLDRTLKVEVFTCTSPVLCASSSLHFAAKFNGYDAIFVGKARAKNFHMQRKYPGRLFGESKRDPNPSNRFRQFFRASCSWRDGCRSWTFVQGRTDEMIQEITTLLCGRWLPFAITVFNIAIEVAGVTCYVQVARANSSAMRHEPLRQWWHH
jgi:hypothetical protein